MNPASQDENYFEQIETVRNQGCPEIVLWATVLKDCVATLKDRNSFPFDKYSARSFIFKKHICFELLAEALGLLPDQLRERVRHAILARKR